MARRNSKAPAARRKKVLLMVEARLKKSGIDAELSGTTAVVASSFSSATIILLAAAAFTAFRWSMMKPIGSAALAWTQAVTARCKILWRPCSVM